MKRTVSAQKQRQGVLPFNTRKMDRIRNDNSASIGGRLYKGSVLSKYQKPQDEDLDSYQLNQNYSNQEQLGFGKIRPQTGILPQRSQMHSTNYNNKQNNNIKVGNLFPFANSNVINNNIVNSQGRNINMNKLYDLHPPPRTAPTANGNPRQKMKSQILSKQQNSYMRPGTTQPQKNKKSILDSEIQESELFPSIYFAKTSLRSLLKELIFPQNTKPLTPDDERTPLIFQILSKLFNEISFYIFNLLVCQHKVTGNFQIFFSDAEIIPFSKCCNSPIFVELDESGSGKILCNTPECSQNILTQFQINIDDGQKLWKNQGLFREEQPDKERNVRSKISHLINTGNFKKISLMKELKRQQKSIGSTYKPDHIKQFDQNQQSIQKSFEFDDINLQQELNIEGDNINKYPKKQQQSQTQQKHKQFDQYKQQLSNGLTLDSQVFAQDFERLQKSKYENSHKQGREAGKEYNPRIHLKSQLKTQKQNVKNTHHEQAKINREQDDEQTLLEIKNLINDFLE